MNIFRPNISQNTSVNFRQQVSCPSFGANNNLSPVELTELANLQKRIETLNQNDDFIPQDLSKGQVNDKISHFFRLQKYIENNPVLSKLGFSQTDLETFLVNFLKIDFGFKTDIDEKQAEFEELIKFVNNPENKDLKDKVAFSLLLEIFCYGKKAYSDMPLNSIKNGRKIFSEPRYAPVLASFKSDDDLYNYLISCLSSSEDTKKFQKVGDLLSNPKYDLLRNTKISPFIFRYQGNYEKLFDKMLHSYSLLKSGETLALNVSEDGKQIVFETKGKDNNGLQYCDREYCDVKLKTKSNAYTIINNAEKITETLVDDTTNRCKYNIVRKKDNNRWKIISLIKTEYDASGEVLNREIIKDSAKEGVLNIKVLDKEGKISTKSGTSTTSSGVNINRHLISKSGFTTDFVYDASSYDGYNVFDYVIKNKSKKVIAQRKIESFPIDKNNILWTINGKNYEVFSDDKEIRIKNCSTDETTTIDLKKLLRGKNNVLGDVLKKMPATVLLNVAQNIDNLYCSNEMQDAICFSLSNTITTTPNPFVLSHELGHALNYTAIDKNKLKELMLLPTDQYKTEVNKLISDKKLLSIFRKEKELFKEKYPEYIVNLTSHFTSISRDNSDLQGLCEIFAEMYGIVNCPQFFDEGNLRTHFIQENFPETIAYFINNYL